MSELPKSRYSLLVTFFVVVSPILDLYQVGPLTIGYGELFLIALCGITMIIYAVRRTKLTLNEAPFSVLFAFYAVIELVLLMFQGNYNLGDLMVKWTKLVTCYLFFEVISKKEFNYEYAKKIVIPIGLALNVLLIIQFLLFHLFGIGILPYLFNIPNNYVDSDLLQTIYKTYIARGTWRPSAIFFEPAQYAQFMLIPTTMMIYDDDNNRKSIALALFFSLGIALSGSANGVLIAVIVWGNWLLKKIRKIRADRLVILFLASISILYFAIQKGILSAAWNRVMSIDLKGAGTTGNQRLIQGLAVFSRVPLHNKIFGTGVGNLRYILVTHNIVTPYVGELGNEYMNGFSTVLVTCGLIFFFVYAILWIRWYRRLKNPIDRGLAVVLSLLFCTSSIFYHPITILYFTIISCRKVSKHEC
ncbi:MAG: hypothetical protein K6D96_09920 [Acetatifactor sp.]|nr:hypothetical protein [Acetatifactor sp.]